MFSNAGKRLLHRIAYISVLSFADELQSIIVKNGTKKFDIKVEMHLKHVTCRPVLFCDVIFHN